MGAITNRLSSAPERILDFDIYEELNHGIIVSNLAFAVAEELGLSTELCHELAIAGVLHDIGKLKLTSYINGHEQDPMMIEELKYVRMHSTLGYEELKDQDYTDFILESILYHHENYDGSGYPYNKSGDSIPIGARIIRVCDVYASLRANHSYRSETSVESALALMIEEVKNFDMKVFLAFQKVIHTREFKMGNVLQGGNYGIKEETGYRNEGYSAKRNGNP